MIIGVAALVKATYFLLNRIASWFGAGYLFKKGYRKKKPWYYAWAIFLSLLMFGLLYWGLHLIHKSKHINQAPNIQIRPIALSTSFNSIKGDS